MIACVTCTDCTYVYIYICYLLLSSCFLFFYNNIIGSEIRRIFNS